jgi:hypothetical protein
MAVSTLKSYVYADKNNTNYWGNGTLSWCLYPKHVTDAIQQDLVSSPVAQREGGFERELWQLVIAVSNPQSCGYEDNNKTNYLRTGSLSQFPYPRPLLANGVVESINLYSGLSASNKTYADCTRLGGRPICCRDMQGGNLSLDLLLVCFRCLLAKC